MVKALNNKLDTEMRELGITEYTSKTAHENLRRDNCEFKSSTEHKVKHGDREKGKKTQQREMKNDHREETTVPSCQ